MTGIPSLSPERQPGRKRGFTERLSQGGDHPAVTEELLERQRETSYLSGEGQNLEWDLSVSKKNQTCSSASWAGSSQSLEDGIPWGAGPSASARAPRRVTELGSLV